MLNFGFLNLVLTDSAPKLEEELRFTDDQAVSGFQDSRTPNDDGNTDGHEDTSNEKQAKRPSHCRPIPAKILQPILARRTRVLRNLGVRVIVTSKLLRKILLKTRKVVRPVQQRAGNDSALCQEQSVLVTTPANVEATVAYTYYSVSCPQPQCSVMIPSDSNPVLVIGQCVKKTASMVVPFYNNCVSWPLTLTFGCACRCIRNA